MNKVLQHIFVIALAALALFPGPCLAATITAQPQSRTNFIGQTVRFAVQASGTEPIQYQWRFKGSDMGGQTNAVLEFPATSPSVEGAYTVRVTDSAGQVESAPADLKIIVPGFAGIRLDGSPSLTSYRGQNGLIVFVSTTGNSSGGLWGTGVYTDDSSIQTAVVHAGLLAHGEQGVVAVEILPGQGSYIGSTQNGVTSTSYGAWVGSYAPRYRLPGIRSQPSDLAGFSGFPGQLSVEPENPSATLNYQWYFNGAAIPGATSTTLRFPSLSPANAGAYSVSVAEDSRTNVSRVAVLAVVDPLPVVETTSGFTSLRLGEQFRFPVVGNADGSIWGTGFYTSDSSVAKAAIHSGLLRPGETGTVAVVVLPGQPSYLGSVRNGVPSAGFGGWGLSYALLGVTPSVTNPPQTVAALTNTPIRFQTGISSRTPATYQWRHNGNPIAGATNATLDFIATDRSGGFYDVVVTNQEGPTASHASRLLIPPADTPVRVIGSTSEISREAGIIYRVPLTARRTGGVWGDGIYTGDSSLESAAIHAGILPEGRTGTVSIWFVPGQRSYTGSTRNGVTSISYGEHPVSFTFIIQPQVAYLSLRSAGSVEIFGAPGQRWTIQAAYRLGASWSNVGTVTLVNSTATLNDPQATNASMRFYRAIRQ